MYQKRYAEYLLDGYSLLGYPEPLIKDSIQYSVQRFKGKHNNEFLLQSENGDVFLYENNVLRQRWQNINKENKSEEFFRYKNGRVVFGERFEDIVLHKDRNYIVNHRKGLRMEIWSVKTGHLLYHGFYNERRMKEGWGIEYDEESGNVVVEGIWRNGTLIEVIRCFNGDVMTELKPNGSDSLDPTKRIPIYMGGFRYDENNETFVREGVGCLIDEKTGIASRECEWKDGKELSGVDLADGWYHSISNHVFTTVTESTSFSTVDVKLVIHDSKGLNLMSFHVRDLVISSNCCNDLSELNLDNYRSLQSLRIGNECFRYVQSIKIGGLNGLKLLKIGKNSFTQLKQNSWKLHWQKGNKKWKAFQILNCESLKSIEIGEYSFSDFGGKFELKNLPQLRSIQIGTIGSKSYNFFYSSFVIRGSDMILYVKTIRST